MKKIIINYNKTLKFIFIKIKNFLIKFINY